MRLQLVHDDGTPLSSVGIGPARLIETLHDRQEAMLLLRELHARVPDGNPMAVPHVSRSRITILINRNLGMTPGKMAAQAVHAALRLYGIRQGAVIVLQATPTAIRRDCDVITHDAGVTEVPEGALTAGIARTNRFREDAPETTVIP